MKDSEIGYYIETPKTKNGKRELPLTERAYQAIQRILKNRGKAQPLIVGGYSNFLFLNREGLPKVAGNYEGMVRGLIKKYNKYHTDKFRDILRTQSTCQYVDAKSTHFWLPSLRAGLSK